MLKPGDYIIFNDLPNATWKIKKGIIKVYQWAADTYTYPIELVAGKYGLYEIGYNTLGSLNPTNHRVVKRAFSKSYYPEWF